MTEINSAMFILVAEAFMALLVLALGLFFMNMNRQDKEMATIDKFVTRLKDETEVKFQNLEAILTDDCGMDAEAVAGIIKQLSASEIALFKRIIQMFLERNPELLSDIDTLIANLFIPYYQILVNNRAGPANAEPQMVELEPGTAIKIAGLERINLQLTKQLETAMQTIEEITSEYTRVFSGNQSALELENSRKIMLQIFFEAEQQIKRNLTVTE